MTKEMTIDGIRPPPLPAASVQTTASTTVVRQLKFCICMFFYPSLKTVYFTYFSIFSSQVGTIRPTIAPTRNIVTTVAGSALTAQLSQAPVSTILTQRLIAVSIL